MTPPPSMFEPDNPETEAPATGAGSFVRVSQALVVLAFAVGMSIQVGINPWFTMTVVGTAAAALLTFKWMLDQRDRTPPVKAAPKKKSKSSNRGPVPVAARVGPQRQSQPTAAPVPRAPAARTVVDEFEDDLALLATEPPPTSPVLRVEQRPAAPVATAPRQPLPRSAYGADPMQGYWAMSPGQSRQAASEAPTPKLVLPVQPPPVSQDLRETDVEIIQNLIRKLADDVNSTEARADLPPRLDAMPPPMPPRLPPQQFAATASSNDMAIEKSLQALRVTADSMRSASDVVFRTSVPPMSEPMPLAIAPAVAPVAPPPLPQMGPSRATQIAEAISAGRLDVMLEPILGLDDRDAHHFEVSIRLRDASGQVLDSNTRAPGLSGTGLLPLFDAARLHRTLNVAARLSERGKSGSIFSSYSAESLDSAAFLTDAAEAIHRRAPGAGQLVLTFDQNDIRGFEHPQWAALAEMRALGFWFALAGLNDFDMDFEAMASAGFVFAKLEADVFLNGLQAPSGLVPPDDVCRHLSQCGLTLIVEQIDDADKLARIFGFGVLLGQGQLFGGPRTLRQDSGPPAAGQQVA